MEGCGAVDPADDTSVVFVDFYSNIVKSSVSWKGKPLK